MEYVDHSANDGIVGINEELVTIDNKAHLLNEFFKFKKDNMSEYSIIDSLIEYSDKFGYNYIQLSEEFSDIPGFVDICKNDCINHKIIKSDSDGNIISNDWD